tara:strand:+ start:200 stop:451 length:252 start_codon:yes stop_codon:yes gene_type:complete
VVAEQSHWITDEELQLLNELSVQFRQLLAMFEQLFKRSQYPHKHNHQDKLPPLLLNLFQERPISFLCDMVALSKRGTSIVEYI